MIVVTSVVLRLLQHFFFLNGILLASQHIHRRVEPLPLPLPAKGAKAFQGTGGCLLFLNLPTAFRDA